MLSSELNSVKRSDSQFTVIPSRPQYQQKNGLSVALGVPCLKTWSHMSGVGTQQLNTMDSLLFLLLVRLRVTYFFIHEWQPDVNQVHHVSECSFGQSWNQKDTSS